MATPDSIPATSCKLGWATTAMSPRASTNNQKPDKLLLINAKHALLLLLASSACYIIKELVVRSREERGES